MKTFVLFSQLIAIVYGHGALTQPPRRPTTPEYLNKIPPVMRTLSDHELQRYPLEYVRNSVGRQAAEQYPLAYSLPCRGIDFANLVVNTYSPGQVVPFAWQIDAPHQGICEIRLFVGNQRQTLVSTSCANREGIEGVDVTLPTTLDSSCATPGNCFLQFFWDRGVNDESYANCVDFVSGDKPVITSPTPNPKPVVITTSVVSQPAKPTTRTRKSLPKPKPTTRTRKSPKPKPSPTSAPIKRPVYYGKSEAECEHGSQRCCGTLQEFCTCLYGKWDPPRTLILSDQYKCKQDGNFVTVELK